MVGSGLTAVYFLLLVNRAFFGRLAITRSLDPIQNARLDIQLAPVAPRETLPATALALAVLGLGLLPIGLGRISESTTTAMAWAGGAVESVERSQSQPAPKITSRAMNPRITARGEG
jgi:NAD(P)H-quinone oxidoreductase subunit 4